MTWYSPTGVAGCELYGTGIASWYSGPGVARNDCEYPWTNCTPIRIESLDTGRAIVVVPSGYCDCFATTSEQRLVDLDPAALSALGLDPSKGLYAVEVLPASPSTPGSRVLPNTALPR